MHKYQASLILGAILALGTFVGCGDDDRPPTMVDSGPGITDSGPGITDGGGRDTGPGLDAGPGFDAGPGLDAGPGDDAGGDLCDGVDCSGLDDECNRGECNPATGACAAAPLTDGTTCDDGDLCTDTDVCTGGTCGGSAADCSAMTDMCNTGSCDPTTGACMATPATDGTACNDGMACTSPDVCTSGTCAGTATDCSGMTDMCNMGMCDPSTGGCVAMAVTDGTACDDASLCTTTDVCTSGTCAGTAIDCSGSGDMCNVGTCDPSTGACGPTPVADGTACDDADMCTATDVCTSGTCGGTATAPAGDTCGTRIVLPSTDGLHTIMGNNTCATDTQRGSCHGTGGRELAYTLRLPFARNVRLETVAPGSMQYDTTLYIRSTCADTASQVACNDDGGAGLLSRINTTLSAGTYSVFVDGFSAASAGNFQLELEITPPDTCASVGSIAVPAVGSTTSVTGTTTGAANSFTSTCGASAASPDQVFSFSVTSTTRLRLETVTPPASYDTVLHVRGANCATGATLACNDDSGAGLLSRIDRVFTPGTYHVIVDGFSTGSSGAYTLEIENLGVVVAYPESSATVCRGTTCTTLGAIGSSRYFQTGNYLEQTVTFAGVPSLSSLDLAFDMNDQTAGCAIGDTHSFAVTVNGTSVGTYSFVTPGSPPAGTISLSPSYTFAPVTGTGAGGNDYTIRMTATTTVCPGGNSWMWIPGGTAIGG